MITIENLTKVYGEVTVVNNISIQVQRAEICGLFGHNGAGKTTTIECLEGFRTPTAGYIRMLGLAPQRQARWLRLRIGIQHQHTELPDRIKVWETLDVIAAMYDRSADYDLLIDQAGLGEKRNTTFAKLSTG
jgi:ABC-2 type transport system ATP-binding protein